MDASNLTAIDGTEEWINHKDKRPGRVIETTVGLTVFIWYNSKIEKLGGYGMDRSLFETLREKDVDLIEVDDAEVSLSLSDFEESAEIREPDDYLYNETRDEEELIVYVD